jgi:hypothetical protein
VGVTVGVVVRVGGVRRRSGWPRGGTVRRMGRVFVGVTVRVVRTVGARVVAPRAGVGTGWTPAAVRIVTHAPQLTGAVVG